MLRRDPGAQRARRECARGRRQHQPPVELHVPDEAGDRAARAGKSRELAGARAESVCGARRESCEQRRQLDQAAAARQRVDEAGAEGRDQDEKDFSDTRCGGSAARQRAAASAPRAPERHARGLCAAASATPASYQCSMSRNETDCGGGRPGKPGAMSSRVNQRTSSSSSSARGTASGRGPRREADHQRRRERPRLRRVILAFGHRDAGFLAAPRGRRRPRGSRPARRNPQSSNSGPLATTPGVRATPVRRR